MQTPPRAWRKLETPPGGISQSESGASYVNGVAAADNRLVRLDTDSVPTDRTLSLTDLIGGRVPYERADGRGLFDAVEESSFAENGVYYEVPVFNQRIGADGTGTAGDWVDENFEPDAEKHLHARGESCTRLSHPHLFS